MNKSFRTIFVERDEKNEFVRQNTKRLALKIAPTA